MVFGTKTSVGGRAMSVTFDVAPTVAGIWRLDVREAHNVLKVLGHIKRLTGRGTYAYYRGRDNNSVPEFEDANLDELKKMVAGKP
jgi:hypothetical protein